jgi:hypothetical protein
MGDAVSGWWRRCAGLRAGVGFVVGQLVALQLLLVGVVATQMAAGSAASPFAICYGSSQSPDGTGTGSNPHVKHTSCVVCAFASCAPPLLSFKPFAANLHVASATFHAVRHGLIGDADRYDPRQSQGPPYPA